MVREDGDRTAVRRYSSPPRLLLLLGASAMVNAASIIYAIGTTRAAVNGGHAPPWLLLGCVSVLAIAASGALLVTQARRLTARLNDLGGTLARVCAGDLTVIVADDSTDDLGAVSRSINAVVANFRAVVVSFIRSTSAMRASWQEVEEVGFVMSNGAETLSIQAFAAASAAEQVSNSIHLVAAATEELAATVREVAVHAAEATTVALTAGGQAGLAGDSVRELDTAAQRVGDLSKLITNIAGQTHLLALNATIEAARAGELGRGFAVVAGEVKELARETASATDTVTKTVNEIQIGSGRANNAIAAITSTIATVTENQGAIASAVVQQTAATNEISRVAAHAAAGSTQIAAAISRISDASRGTAYAGGQARTTAGELAALERSLTALLESFSVGDIADEETTDDTPRGITVVDGVTIVQDAVQGTGLNAFDYRGDGWLSSKGNVKTGGTNTYNCTPGAVAVIRFVGTRIRFYGIGDPSHGIAAASVDGGSETMVDLYRAERESGVVNWDSGVLASGEHRLELRVANDKHPQSGYFWVAVDRVDIS